MATIPGVQLAAGRFISDSPQNGVLAAEKGDGSTQDLMIADETTGDVSFPAFGAGGAHLFGGDLKAAGEVFVHENLNVRSWANLTGVPAAFVPAPHVHGFAEITATPSTLSGYGISDAYSKTEADARYSPISHTHPVSQVTGLLDGNGRVLSSLLPAIAITDTFVVADQAAMLALTAETGDVAIRSDESKTYILRGANPALLASWELLSTPTAAVASVNGMTGVVSLTAATVGAAAIAHEHALTDTAVTGVLPPSKGGLGFSGIAKGEIVAGTATNTVGKVAAASTDGHVLTWNNTTGLPEWRVTSAAGGGMADGTAAAPGSPFNLDPDTGFFRPGADTLAISTAGAERLRVLANGNLLVGLTVDAGYKLDVSGNARATAFYESSSRTVKRNIAPWRADAGEYLDAIEIVQYQYKSQEDEQVYIGFIAEDTDPLFSGVQRCASITKNLVGALVREVQTLRVRLARLEGAAA